MTTETKTIKSNLVGYTKVQMEELLGSLGQKPYKGRQLFKWLYFVRQPDFQLMTDLAKDLRTELDEKFVFDLPKIVTDQVSTDGTRKFLSMTPDDQPIESVLVTAENREAKTACISSQSGCALGCLFCATGTMGLKRNLTAGEIVGQLIHMRNADGADCFSNVVFMGMGEPMNNFDNLMTALEIMTHPEGLNIGGRRITISTCGITPRIKKLADNVKKVRLALSLHAATQEKREKIMPIAKRYPLAELMQAVRYYAEKTDTRATIEYILFDGFNDTLEDVKAFREIIRGVPCKINILAYNPVPGLDFKRPSDDKVDWFAQKLYPHTPIVTVRKSRGRDIDAACGQLAGKYLSDNK